MAMAAYKCPQPIGTVESRPWEEVEAELNRRERSFLEKRGIKLADNHMDGYKYRPKQRINRIWPWDVVSTPNTAFCQKAENWTHEDVLLELGEGIAYITLNRPYQNNSINDTLARGLHDATCDLAVRKDIRVVVLKAEGRVFCAGGDPQAFTDAAAMSDKESRLASIHFMKYLRMLSMLPQFTIACCQGSAMGSGVGLMAACDMVIATKGAHFTLAEVKLGTIPATVVPFIMTKAGISNTKRLVCTGENITAEKAKFMGLIQEVVETPEDFSPLVREICEKLTLCAPLATSCSKRLATNVASQPMSREVLEYTGEELAFIRTQDEAVKGMVAIQAKAKPPWAEKPINPKY